jgi:hypothetical protein
MLISSDVSSTLKRDLSTKTSGVSNKDDPKSSQIVPIIKSSGST